MTVHYYQLVTENTGRFINLNKYIMFECIYKCFASWSCVNMIQNETINHSLYIQMWNIDLQEAVSVLPTNESEAYENNFRNENR